MKVKISAIIPAAGSSKRFGENKLIEKINGIPVIIMTLRVISEIQELSELIIPTNESFF